MNNEKIKNNLKKEVNEPSIIGIIILLIITIGMWYLFKNYGLSEIINILSDFVKGNEKITYFLAFFLAFAEGTVILAMMPGSIAILTLGAIAAKGDLNIIILYILVVFGAIIGDNFGYFLGGIFGKRIIKSGFIDPLQYRLAEDYVEKHGGKSIAISRLVNGIKELAPFVAGSMKMDKKKFMIFNFLGAIGWAFLWLGVGYVFFQNLELVEKYLSQILKAIGVLFALGVGWYIYKNQHLLEDIKNDYK